MLQYLLDEHLPGYHLPKRKLKAYPWSVDTLTSGLRIKCCRIGDTGRAGNVVAIRDLGDLGFYRYILCSDGTEYRVWEYQRHSISCQDFTHCARLDYVKMPPPDVKDYLI